MIDLLETIGEILSSGDNCSIDGNEIGNGAVDSNDIGDGLLGDENISTGGSDDLWNRENNNLYEKENADKSNISMKGRKHGECNWCGCLCYIPKPGTTECICGHSKHSHIGL